MTEKWPDIVVRWRDAWTSLDADRVAALYAEDGEHMSSVVTERLGITNGTLKSRAAIHTYALAAAKRLTRFQADIIDVVTEQNAEGGKASVEYWRILNGNTEGRTRVIEILEWRQNEITSCRVFHF